MLQIIPIPDRFESNPTLANGVWIVATMPSPIQSDLEAVLFPATFQIPLSEKSTIAGSDATLSAHPVKAATVAGENPSEFDRGQSSGGLRRAAQHADVRHARLRVLLPLGACLDLGVELPGREQAFVLLSLEQELKRDLAQLVPLREDGVEAQRPTQGDSVPGEERCR